MFYGTDIESITCEYLTSLENGDFESPIAGTTPTNLPLGWVAESGVYSYGHLESQYSAYVVNDPANAVSGSQYTELAYAGTYLEQTINIPAGEYFLTFYARQRPGYSYTISFSVYINDVRVFGTMLTDTWASYSISNIETLTNLTTIRFANDPTSETGELNYPLYVYYNQIDEVILSSDTAGNIIQ
jgi:hypothetical protein